MSTTTKFGICLLLTLIIFGILQGAGTVTETTAVRDDVAAPVINKTTLTWVSDANGDAAGTYTTNPVNGWILRVVTIPDTTDVPTNNYDIVLYDSDTQDVLQGLGANEPNTTSNQFCPALDFDDGTNYTGLVAVRGKLELQVSNAGASKSGKVVLYWK